MTKPWIAYDKTINKHGVPCGTTLDFWRSKNWITDWDPYGWGQWYCNFSTGRRCVDDLRQIKRWNMMAGPNGRFRKFLVTMIVRKKGSWDDIAISPKIRQS